MNSSDFLSVRNKVKDPEHGLSYPELLRGNENRFEILANVFIALFLFILIVPLTSTLILLITYSFRKGISFKNYVKMANDYIFPEGIVASHIGLAMLILLSLFMIRYRHGIRAKWLCSVKPGMRWRYLGACLIVGVIVLNVIAWIFMLGKPLAFLSPAPGWQIFLITVLITSPFQAAAEEFFFRGYLLQALGSTLRNKWLGVVSTALIFALLHGMQNLALILDRFAFGLLAGVLVVMTGGIEAGIGAHIVNNVSAMIYALFSGGIANVKTITAITWTDMARDVIAFGTFGLVSYWISRKMKLTNKT